MSQSNGQNNYPDSANKQSLNDLAVKINAEHKRAEQSAKNAIAHALKAGELLIAAKSKVEHGEWLPWLEQHCTVSERTAQAYMRIAKEWPKLDAPKAQRVADLSFRETLKALAAPSKPASNLGRVKERITQQAEKIEDPAERLEALSEATEKAKHEAMEQHIAAIKEVSQAIADAKAEGHSDEEISDWLTEQGIPFEYIGPDPRWRDGAGNAVDMDDNEIVMITPRFGIYGKPPHGGGMLVRGKPAIEEWLAVGRRMNTWFSVAEGIIQ